MTAIADVLCDAGHSVYLPHRDGMEFRHVHHILQDRGWAAAEAGQFLHAAIFALDVFQLVERCDCVVWNLNGRTPDEGAVSESAIAWTLGKPIVGYKDDVRTKIAGRDNPLLAGLLDWEMVDEITKIPAALDRELARMASMGSSAMPPKVARAVQDGRDLWSVMHDQEAVGNNEVIADVVTQLFAPQSSLVR
jgi:nucleoside 2-deoxyribosyltransferase